MNNDNDLNLHLHDQMSGWLRYCWRLGSCSIGERGGGGVYSTINIKLYASVFISIGVEGSIPQAIQPFPVGLSRWTDLS